jgi:hypothetical protein
VPRSVHGVVDRLVALLRILLSGRLKGFPGVAFAAV